MNFTHCKDMLLVRPESLREDLERDAEVCAKRAVALSRATPADPDGAQEMLNRWSLYTRMSEMLATLEYGLEDWRVPFDRKDKTDV